jgi:hypothetical protein
MVQFDQFFILEQGDLHTLLSSINNEFLCQESITLNDEHRREQAGAEYAVGLFRSGPVRGKAAR